MNKGVGSSLFAMCRCAVALAYVDGFLAKEEKEMLQDFFNTLPLSNEQEETLNNDLENGAELDYQLLYKQVDDIGERAHLITFAKVLFNSDGHFSIQEKKVLENLLKDHMGDVSDQKGEAVKPANNTEGGVKAGVDYLKQAVINRHEDW